MQEIDVRGHSPAGAHMLYELLIDAETWPVWSPIGSFTLERPGPDGPASLGAIRLFKTGRVHSREELVELVPDRRLSYVLLSGMPLRGYRADVDLTPTGAGTDIRWHSTFQAKVPGTGWLYRLVLERFIRRCVAGLAAHPARV